jgi:hypothetical protein
VCYVTDFTAFHSNKEKSDGLSRLVDRVPVRGCVLSEFEVIDKYEWIIKDDERHNRQVGHYSTCMIHFSYIFMW